MILTVKKVAAFSPRFKVYLNFLTYSNAVSQLVLRLQFFYDVLSSESIKPITFLFH